jgi:hypothetical protein
MWFIGYDGNIGAGIYVFSQGHLGFPLPDGTVFGGPGNPSGRSLDGVPVRDAIPLSQSYAPKTTNPILVELIDIAATIEGVIGDAVGIAELPVRVIGGIADRSWDEVRVAFTSAITPKYGAYAGPGWGGETAGGLPPLDNAIDIASQAHDQAYAAAKSDIGPANSGYSNAIRTADGQLIQDAYAGPVGIFGSVYRAGLNAIFTAKIALTPPE